MSEMTVNQAVNSDLEAYFEATGNGTRTYLDETGSNIDTGEFDGFLGRTEDYDAEIIE